MPLQMKNIVLVKMFIFDLKRKLFVVKIKIFGGTVKFAKKRYYFVRRKKNETQRS